jgi:Arc/MetJ-type ribon-helix-helix transcriptional regulator
LRTSVTLPEPLFAAAKRLAEGRSFSDFVREALELRVQELRRADEARELEAGYRSEAEAPSLDPAWTATETEGW